MLTSRRQRVLMALVDEYVESATPVGSSRIAQHYLREVSPATIRNELMNLENEGYALSPHTSAGRVPTNTGYRVFVNTLLLRGALPEGGEIFARTAGKLDGDSIRKLDGEHRIDATLSVLAETTGLFSLIFTIRPERGVFHRGMPQLLTQPEFHESSALVPLMRLIEDTVALGGFLKPTLDGNSFRVKVGIEDNDRYMSAYSMVAESFEDEQLQGILAVFGPTRMDYRRVIPAVSFASKLLDGSRTRTFGR